MADVRSLLRQQRAARRIEHPHAAYSDAGKLLCTICHEQIKTESLWDSHVRSDGHKTRIQNLQKTTTTSAAAAKTNGHGEDGGDGASQPKRKHNEDEDETMEDVMRRKRSRADISAASRATEGDGEKEDKDQNLTPPRMIRRTSTTPSQGVELQIPSRPATPAHRDGSSASTPGAASAAVTSHSTTSLLSRQPSTLAADAESGKPNSTAPQVDEAEWAAFEADIAAASAPYTEDAVISAPAMTADEAAAKARAEEEAAENRRTQADVDLEDEKEEATRALEEEFDEMEELEARVRRLKEKREALRKREESLGPQAVSQKPDRPGKENIETPLEEKEEEDDDDDEEDPDWDGFGFWNK